MQSIPQTRRSHRLTLWQPRYLVLRSSELAPAQPRASTKFYSLSTRSANTLAIATRRQIAGRDCDHTCCSGHFVPRWAEPYNIISTAFGCFPSPTPYSVRPGTFIGVRQYAAFRLRLHWHTQVCGISAYENFLKFFISADDFSTMQVLPKNIICRRF